MIYKCTYCGKEYDTIRSAAACEEACQKTANEVKEEYQAQTAEAKQTIYEAVDEVNELAHKMNDCTAKIKDLREALKEMLINYKGKVSNISDLIDHYENLVPNNSVSYSIDENNIVTIDIKEIEPEVLKKESNDIINNLEKEFGGFKLFDMIKGLF